MKVHKTYLHATGIWMIYRVCCLAQWLISKKDTKVQPKMMKIGLRFLGAWSTFTRVKARNKWCVTHPRGEKSTNGLLLIKVSQLLFKLRDNAANISTCNGDSNDLWTWCVMDHLKELYWGATAPPLLLSKRLLHCPCRRAAAPLLLLSRRLLHYCEEQQLLHYPWGSCFESSMRQ